MHNYFTLILGTKEARVPKDFCEILDSLIGKLVIIEFVKNQAEIWFGLNCFILEISKKKALNYILWSIKNQGKLELVPLIFYFSKQILP